MAAAQGTTPNGQGWLIVGLCFLALSAWFSARSILGLTMGILSAGHALGAAFGAFMGGQLFDLFAKYDWVWIASVALAILASLMVFAIPEDRGPVAVPAAAPAGG